MPQDEIEFNPNDFMAKLAVESAAHAFTRLTSLAKQAKLRLLPATTRHFQRYIESALESTCRVKTLFIRDAEPLWTFYIPSSVQIRTHRINAAGISNIARHGKRFVVTGTAGSGKSIFMRHLFLDAVREKTFVPVFIELRSLNHTSDGAETSILKHLSSLNLHVDPALMQHAIEKGLFLFLLDGIDEVAPERRATIDAEIRELASKWNNNIFIVSSRPDQGVARWRNFATLSMCPLSKDDAISLVELIPYDSGVKSRFIKRLTDDLYAQRTEFCENPLLLSIMLLTYEKSATVPEKHTTFYNQAYEALFDRHDAGKEGFIRPKKSGLELDDFEQAAAWFSAASYEDRAFSFSRSDGLRYATAAREATRREFRESDLINDLQHATCLLVDDGLQLAYTHRSFQEYFVARLISWQPTQEAERLTRACARFIDQDTVISLLHELRPSLVESVVVLPLISRLRKVVGRSKRLSKAGYLRFIEWKYEDLSVSDGSWSETYTANGSETLAAMEFLVTQYGNWGEHLTNPYPDVDTSEAAAYVAKKELNPVSASEFRSHPPLVAWMSRHGEVSFDALQNILNAESTILESHAKEAKAVTSFFRECK